VAEDAVIAEAHLVALLVEPEAVVVVVVVVEVAEDVEVIEGVEEVTPEVEVVATVSPHLRGTMKKLLLCSLISTFLSGS